MSPNASVSTGFLPKGHDMARQPRGIDRPSQPAAGARDRALSRVRRTTATIGVAAIASAVGLGLLAATETTAHSSATQQPSGASTSGSSASTSPTTTASPSGSSSSSASAADPTTTTTTTTMPKATTTKPVTVSRQS
jgi:hypothetical protein